MAGTAAIGWVGASEEYVRAGSGIRGVRGATGARAGRGAAGPRTESSTRRPTSVSTSAIVSASGTCSHRLPASLPAPMTCTAAIAHATGIRRCAVRQRRAPRRCRA